jgi:uncharacterized protein
MATEPRFYREWTNTSDLVSFVVAIKETDLQIRARGDLTIEATAAVRRVRRELESYIAAVPEFLTSFSPLPRDPKAPIIVQTMLEAGIEYGVGPMAAVAGAVAEEVGKELLASSSDVIVENGGDIFLKMSRPVTLGLYAGEHSPFTRRIVLKLDCAGSARGVCTSSRTVGPSVSFGRADAVVTIAETAGLADAAATAIGNRIRTAEDLENVLQAEQDRGRLLGCLAVIGHHLGAYGEIEIA